MIGQPLPRIKWLCDDHELQRTPKVSIIKGDNGQQILTITNVTLKMSGQYKVIASNNVGQAQHSATVIVTGKTRVCCEVLYNIHYVIYVVYWGG